MAKDAAQRYTTAADLAAALRAAVEPKCGLRAVRRRVFLALLAATGAGLVGIGAFMVARSLGRQENVQGPSNPQGTGGDDSPGTPSTVKELEVKVFVRRALEVPSSITIPGNLPVRAGENIGLEVALPGPGWVYVLRRHADDTREWIWQKHEGVDADKKCVWLKIPAPQKGDNIWLRVEGEKDKDFGTEMILVGVANKPLSKMQLEQFRDVPFEPSPAVSNKAHKELLQVPVPRREWVRSEVSETELVLGKPFADQIKSLPLRCFRVLIYGTQP